MRKSIFLLSTALMLLTLARPVAASGDITGWSDSFGSGGVYFNDEERRSMRDVADLNYLGKIEPGTEIFIRLRSSDFEWDGERRPLTSYRIGEENFSPAIQMYQGEDVMDSVSISWRGEEPGLLIRFAPYLKSTEPEEFAGEVSFAGGSFEIRGTFANRSVSVGRYTKEAKLGPGRCAQALYEDARDVRFDLGEGIAIRSDLDFAETAWGMADTSVYAEDRLVMERYPQIRYVVRVQVENLKGPVSFDKSRYGGLLVYDGMLNLLGEAENLNQFVTVCYLSDGKLT